MTTQKPDTHLCIIYADSGLGKTTNTIFCAPNSLFVGELTAVRSVARSVCGIELPIGNIEVPDDFDQVIGIIRSVAEGKRKLANGKPVQSLVLDDFTLLALRHMAKLEVDPKFMGRSGPDFFKIQNAFAGKILELRETARRAYVHVFVSAHMGHPHVNNLTHQPILGGPRLKGQIQQDIGQAFDEVYRCTSNPNLWSIGYPASAHVGDSADYVTKDRLNVVFGEVPLNLSEIFRYRGYAFTRFEGLEWLDEAITKYSEIIAANVVGEQMSNRAYVLGITAQLRRDIEAKYTKKVEWQNWCLQDAYHRVLIKNLVEARSVNLWG